jgi:hypothetical protein
MISPQIKEFVNPVSDVIYDWLAAEVASSSDPTDVNAPLDDYKKAVEGLEGGFDHKSNVTWKKHSGHSDRLIADFNNLASSSPQEKYFDKFAAKLEFDDLIEVSGTYRNQCYAEASSQEDYLRRRRQVIGISIKNVVKNCLTDLIPMNGDFTDARISIEGLAKRKDETIQAGDRVIENLINIMSKTKERRTEDDRDRAVNLPMFLLWNQEA